MLKKLLDILKRRQYISPKTREEFNYDLKKEVDRKIEKMDNSFNELLFNERKKTIEIQVLIEVMKDNPNLYSEAEFYKIFNEIIHEKQNNLNV